MFWNEICITYTLACGIIVVCYEMLTFSIKINREGVYRTCTRVKHTNYHCICVDRLIEHTYILSLFYSTVKLLLIVAIWSNKMARRHLEALRNETNLARFVVEGRCTGKHLGTGSYGSVEEVLIYYIMMPDQINVVFT